MKGRANLLSLVRCSTLRGWLGHTGVAAYCLSTLLLLTHGPGWGEPKKKTRPPPAVERAVFGDDAAARLVEVYRLIGQARGRHALARAEALVEDHPNFQLAQLVHGDLLSTQTRPVRAIGDVSEAAAKSNSLMLAALCDESQLRMGAFANGRQRTP